MFSTGRLLDALIQSQMGGGSGRRGRRRRRSRGLGGAVRGAALSPQGLTLLGGLAIAAIEHLRGKGEPTFSGGTPGGTGNTGSAPAGGARPDLPPLPSDPDGARAGLPPLPDQVGAASASPDSTPATPTTPEQDALARVLVLAMIEAAKADGVVDEQEKARIEAQLQEAGASDEEREWARGQLAAAPDLPGLLAAVPSPLAAAQVYAAALVVVDVQNAAEREFLGQLARGLGLSVQMTEELQLRIDAAIGAREEAPE